MYIWWCFLLGWERCARNRSRACAHHVERLSHLLHDASLPLWERRVPPQFIFDVFHLDLDSAFGLFAVTRWRLFGLEGVVGVFRDIVNSARLQAHALRGHPSVVVADVAFETAPSARARHHRVARRKLLQAGGGPPQAGVAVYLWRRFAWQQVHAVPQVESGIPPARWFHFAPQFDNNNNNTASHLVYTALVHTNTAEHTIEPRARLTAPPSALKRPMLTLPTLRSRLHTTTFLISFSL